MSAQTNAQPIIIKRKKVVGGGGHHGGAWKVAYADFVTAMMAFFMLMWLLNATTEQQRKGIADYFSPTIPINRVSGGGNGAFGGESIFSEMTLPKEGTGSTAQHAARDDKARGDSGNTPDAEASEIEEQRFRDLDAQLQGMGGESLVMENAKRHIVTRITDEGLVIELFDLDDVFLFQKDSNVPNQILRDLAALIAGTVKTVTNKIAVGAHVRANPIVLADSPVWELSAQRAAGMRTLLEDNGVMPRRIRRVTGHADRAPVVADPMANRNNRIEIILLRDVPRN
ncbi:Motility protein B [Sulfitobacter sp. THAF37]|uniref:flagellar motor protein MotB n=1 Tax=Sulfitobacter sp. THAF37 TaxID=2587855 RepID=UPI0012681DE6|nr:flagellar motor protein MotB [Sulfitobacter sp. THAF37]QFT58389.1 Motility protein B [Sulfitobacter sp. THAF37]